MQDTNPNVKDDYSNFKIKEEEENIFSFNQSTAHIQYDPLDVNPVHYPAAGVINYDDQNKGGQTFGYVTQQPRPFVVGRNTTTTTITSPLLGRGRRKSKGADEIEEIKKEEEEEEEKRKNNNLKTFVVVCVFLGTFVVLGLTGNLVYLLLKGIMEVKELGICVSAGQVVGHFEVEFDDGIDIIRITNWGDVKIVNSEISFIEIDYHLSKETNLVIDYSGDTNYINVYDAYSSKRELKGNIICYGFNITIHKKIDKDLSFEIENHLGEVFLESNAKKLKIEEYNGKINVNTVEAKEVSIILENSEIFSDDTFSVTDGNFLLKAKQGKVSFNKLKVNGNTSYIAEDGQETEIYNFISNGKMEFKLKDNDLVIQEIGGDNKIKAEMQYSDFRVVKCSLMGDVELVSDYGNVEIIDCEMIGKQTFKVSQGYLEINSFNEM